MTRPGLEVLEGRTVPTAVVDSDGFLTVTGTNGNDILTVNATHPERTLVAQDGRLVGTFNVFSAVIIDGRGGNDVIQLIGSVLEGALKGGPGNDFIYGGGTGDLLLGGPGNDYLSGAGGNDLLLGGLGTDTLLGGAGRDILIGGELPFSDDTLAAARDEWAATAVPGPLVLALLGQLDDPENDFLAGGSGADLSIHSLTDTLSGVDPVAGDLTILV